MSQRRKLLVGTLVDTVKLKGGTCVKEKDGIGTVFRVLKCYL